MNVVFRADASSSLGSGHVIRCLTLAEALREQGHKSLFVCREDPGHLCDVVRDRGFGVARIRPEAGWSGDARATVEAITQSEAACDLLVTDHYGIDAGWERALRTHTNRILVIDDLADRVHECDYLLDQNLVADRAGRYHDKVPDACIRMLGPEFALLQPIYAELRSRMTPRVGVPARVLVFFSGAEHGGLIDRTVDAVLDVSPADVHVDVVAHGQPSAHPNAHAHPASLPTLAHLMAQADLAVGAAGAASYERLCLGLPAFVAILADNQRPISEELGRQGLVRELGPAENITRQSLAAALADVFDHGLPPDWSSRCLQAVDGRGTARVCAVLTLTASAQLHVRHAGPDDEGLVLRWANDHGTRRHAFRPEPIDAATHGTWFRERLGNPASYRFYIIEGPGGMPVGQVRFECLSETWTISVTVAPEFRGRGLGRPVLQAGIDQLRTETGPGELVAHVKERNVPSMRVMRGLGFEVRAVQGGVTEWRRHTDVHRRS